MYENPKSKIAKAVYNTYKLVNKIKKPKNFVLTGTPRSSTSFLSKLLSTSKDCFCFNEIHYTINTLPLFFLRMRFRFSLGRPVPVKIDKNGNLTEDTTKGETLIKQKKISRKIYKMKLGSNVNHPYLTRIDKIIDLNYKILIMIRSPIYVIGSWGSKKASHLPAAKVGEDDLSPRWEDFNFNTNDKICRRAEIWEYYAKIIWSIKDNEKTKIIRYKDFVNNTRSILNEIAKFLEIEKPVPEKSIKNYNIEERYNNVDSIKEAVKKYCPTMEKFGYKI